MLSTSSTPEPLGASRDAGTGHATSFGPFRLLLLEGDRPVGLESRVFDILIALADRSTKTIGKNALLLFISF